MRNESEVIELIKNKLNPLDVKKLRTQNLAVTLKKDELISGLNYLKAHSYIHLATISCVDWIDDNEFELVYHLFSYEDKINISVKTRIDRKESKFVTIKNIWAVAQYYERDIHDFFGVEFEGNDDMDELILENWNDIPPMRKDFNTREYVDEKYEWREYHG
ncbi:MAG TPA: NADH-quinone oxidoreductase subunit C [Halanaerobiales bacterium]|nr:NADH-quinone oxidoreductase subunit C [Halanaerobiales bacterium]